MALITEDGTGLVNAESYASVAEADAYFALVGNTAWKNVSKATGLISCKSQPSVGNTLVIGSQTYTFQSALTLANQILIGASASETAQNITDAIHYSGTPGTQYHAGTTPNADVTASVSGTEISLVAKVAGAAGNVAITETVSGVGFTVTGMEGGLIDKEVSLRRATAYLDQRWKFFGAKKSETQALEWPRVGVTDQNGFLIQSNVVPLQVKKATYELAVVGLTDMLIDSSSPEEDAIVTSESLSVGPISLSESYGASGKNSASSSRSFVNVSRILRGLTQSSRTVERG